MQFHVEVLPLPFVDAVSAILCAACLAPAHLSCSWCRFLLWVSFGPWGVSSICCCVLFCFCCCFCWRAADKFFMWRRLLCQFWLLLLQFYVLLVLFLRIEIAVGAGSCFWFGSGSGAWAASAVPSAAASATVSVEGLLMQFHVEVPALAVWMLFLQFYVLLALFLCI